tara:strand:+ start:543 stop:1085 length:543 start_codon:yes stop_codon:yes gene_type:complete
MSKSYGILGIFDTPKAVYAAAKKVRDAGYKNWDCITPFPIHGLDDAMGLKRSKVPVFTFIGGITGFCTGMTIAFIMGQLNYPLIVGGKPYFDFVFPFPIAYELTILLGAFGTLGGMFILNRLPMHYHPVMNYDKFRRLTDDQFAIVIETDDPNFDEASTTSFLEGLGALEVTMVSGEESV